MSYRLPGQPTKSVLLTFRVTPEVADRIKGLAFYKRMPYSEMLVQLEAEERKRLVESGKKPPLRPPVAETELSDSKGPRTPRR